MEVDARTFDALLTWVAAVGVVRHLVQVEVARRRSCLESRMRLLLACLALLLLVRGFQWLDPGPLGQVLTFVPATLLPLALILFTEGLLRRHLPWSAKAFVALGTLVFFVANLAGQLNGGDAWVVAFLAFLGLTLLLVVGFLVLRERTSLAPPENRFIDSILIAAVPALLLAITDFRTVIGFPPVRLGSLGALAFVYACVRAGAPAGQKALDLGRLAARTLLLALALVVLCGGAREVWLPCAALALAFVLVFTTWDRVWVQSEQARERSFLRWLQGADLQSLDSFLASLRDCPVAEEHVVLAGEALARFDGKALAKRLEQAGQAASRSQLQRALASKSPAEADDQLLALLDTHGMNHAYLASVDPLVLVLLNYPEHSEPAVVELQIGLLQRLARALPQR